MFTLGVDARATEPGFKAHHGRGTGRYAHELLRALSEFDSPDLKIRHVFSEQLGASGFGKKIVDSIPVGKQTFETQVFLPRVISKLGLDSLHFLSHGDATARCKLPYLVTVLDLIPLRFPQLYQADKPSWRFHLARKLELAAIRKARGILAISEATKKDLVELLGVAPDDVYVTHLGVDSAFQPRESNRSDWEQESKKTKERLGLDADRPVMLYTGGIDARKNIPFLLEVFAEVLQSRNAGKPQLVLAGAYEKDDKFPQLKENIRRLGLENDVKLIGFVSEADLPHLYRAANVKVFPSLYEGFGLPVLEAMASGVPVIAGKNSSLPEVAGNAAVLLPDGDKTQWVGEILSLLLNETRRGQLAQAGKAQARRFTWAKTAESTLEAYRHFCLKNVSRTGISSPNLEKREDAANG